MPLPVATGVAAAGPPTGGRSESGALLREARPSSCVLLVEDEPQVRAPARRLLERCGYRVVEAVDRAEGLRAFETHRSCIDVVLTDVVMPRLGGVEMIGHVRGLVPEVPVAFVSGFTAEDRALPLDARTVFVPKPYTMASLCGAIEAAVAG